MILVNDKYCSRCCCGVCWVLGFVLLSFAFSFISVSSTYASYSITMSYSGVQNVDIIPTVNGNNTSINVDNINVISDCRDGYNLLMSTSVNDNNLYLDGSGSNNASNTYFAPVDGVATLGSSTNKWGYYYNDVNSVVEPSSDNVFSPIPALGNTATIKTISSTVSESDIDDSFNIYYGVSASNVLAPGTYKMIPDSNNSNADGTVVYYLTMSESCGSNYMQDVTDTQMANMMPTEGDAATLIDKRDEQEYSVAKINGKYWMTKNLDLAGGTVLTNDTTNLSNDISPYTLPNSSTTFSSDPTVASVYNSESTTCSESSPCYSYYSYSAATAETNPASGETASDICPKGWRLPSMSEFEDLASTYDTATKITGDPFLGVYAGYYSVEGFDNGASGYGLYGTYWSSTAVADDGSGVLLFNYYPDNIDSAEVLPGPKDFGFSIRCIRKQSYTVRFDANGGSGDMNDQTVIDGDVLNANTFTAPAGKVFVGWNTAADGSGVGYDDEAVVNGMSNETVTLYAQWAVQMQFMTLDQCSTTGSLVADSRTGEVYTVKKITLDLKATCWMMSNLRLPGDSVLTSSDSNVKADYTMPSQTEWVSSSQDDYCIPRMSYVSSNDEYYYNWPAATARTNNTSGLSGCSNDTSNSIGDICPAGWRLPTYTDANSSTWRDSLLANGSLEDTGSFDSGQVSFYRGFWWTSSRYENNNLNAYLLYKAGVSTLNLSNNNKHHGYSVRCMMKERYTIQFDANGGSGSMSDQEAYVGDSVILNSNSFTAPSGKRFAGWNTLANGGGVSYSDGGTITRTNSSTITLYAQWESAPGQCTDFDNCMQLMTLDQCTEVGSSVVDSRTGFAYMVKKVTLNGAPACWMMSNLKLPGGTTLKPVDSNVTTDYTLPSTVSQWPSGLNNEFCKATTIYERDSGEYFYNWPAATARTHNASGYMSSGCDDDTSNSVGDICPAGWRLPTYLEMHSGINQSGIISTLSDTGYYTEIDGRHLPVGGYWWLSTRQNRSNAYNLKKTTDSVTDDNNYKSMGFSVRCMLTN